MRSVLALSSIDFSKHSAVGAYFRKEYIKTGIFDISMSDIISEAFDIRSDSDYNDYFVISKKEVEEQISNAHCRTWNMERKMKITENEKKTV